MTKALELSNPINMISLAEVKRTWGGVPKRFNEMVARGEIRTEISSSGRTRFCENDVLDLYEGFSERSLSRTEPVPTWVKSLVRQARKNAAKRGIAFDLTELDARWIWRQSGGKCVVSGMPFDFSPAEGGRRRPFAPSLDRKDSAKGYTLGNVRLVCCLANMAMNEWGDKPLKRFVLAMASKLRNE